MNEIKFLEDTRKNDIIKALLCNQRSIMIDSVEVFLKPLKNDVFKNKEIAAEKQAIEIIGLLNN